MITEVEGSLLKDIQPYSILLHQVNCLGKMSSGLAAQMAKKFDGLWKSYHDYCGWFQADYNGKSHRNEILGTWHIFRPKDRDDLIIVSAFGQEYASRNEKMTDYDAWEKILKKLEHQTRQANKTQDKDKQWKIHAPYNLGCGLGGGDWEEMYSLLKTHFGNSPVELVLHKLNK